MESPSLIEQVKEKIDLEGVAYTVRTWQLLQARKKPILPEEVEPYSLIQKAHLEFTGYSLPPIKGAKLTRAQNRDALGPEVKEETLEKAIQQGLAAKLRQLRGEL